MIKRRQYLIDRKFQLRQTLLMMSAVFVVFAIVIGIIGISAARNNGRLADINRNNEEMVKNLDAVMLVQDDIIQTMMAWVQKPAAKPGEPVVRQIAQTHFQNLGSIKSGIGTVTENVADNKRIIKNNHILLIILVVLVLVQGGVMFFFMIRKTHKISGPVYVMSGYMKDIIEGKMPNPRALREGDELQDFYGLFTKMVNTLRERQ
ncbi:MAG TPA: hypothetical protein ENN21_08415 [Spirochaetes bacterium]|nr:hypothetical protein [Spirochaetota bacterium]